MSIEQLSIEQYQRGIYTISTDPQRLDVAAVHAYLANSYWAASIPFETVERSLRGSLCFGLYAPERQIGLVRIITDQATFAYVCDVYVLPEHAARRRTAIPTVAPGRTTVHLNAGS